MRYLKILFAMAGLLAAGCGPGNTLSREDAAKAFGSTTPALANGISATASGTVATAHNINFSIDLDCPQGGTASMSANASGNSASAQVSYDANYDACSFDDHNALSGSLQIDVSVASDMQTSANLSYSMVGALTFSGEVNGSCEVNLVMTMGVSRDNGLGIEYQYSGNFCGFTIEDLQAEIDLNSQS